MSYYYYAADVFKIKGNVRMGMLRKIVLNVQLYMEVGVVDFHR